jgi:hypothetical protein
MKFSNLSRATYTPGMSYVVAQFPDARRAAIARDQVVRLVPAGDASIAEPALVTETKGEVRFMGRVVVWIVLASIAGTAIGAALGAFFAFTVGPSGTAGYVIQIVSWAIFMHLLIGMWAGYLLLADRSSREIRRGEPVTMTVRCANIDATALAERLRQLGATSADVRETAPAPN